MPFGLGFGRPGPRDPRGDPDRRIPPTPTLREMQMQAAHRGRGPGGWQTGGFVGGVGQPPVGTGTGMPPGWTCPSPKEHIQLANNDWILAGDLKVGDEVMTSEEPQKVTRVQRIEDSPRCEVLFEDSDSIVTSYSHPYFVNSKGFVEVGDLKKGDIIGDLVVKDKKPFAMGPVISLSVDKAETYMLQGGTKENPVPALSHNKSPVPTPPPQEWLDRIAALQAAREEERRRAAAAAARAQAAAVRTGTQAQRQASRGPGGWQGGGAVGRNIMNPRAAAAEAMIRNAPPPPREQQRIRFEGPNWPFPQGLNPDGTPYVSPLPPAPPPIPGGWQEGGVVDYASNFAAPWHRDADPSEALMAEGTMENPSESLMNERARLQQLLQQTTDEAMAQEILMRIREITKELEIDVRQLGMANGGIASLMGI